MFSERFPQTTLVEKYKDKAGGKQSLREHVKSLMILDLNIKIAATSLVTLCLFLSAALEVSVNVYSCSKRKSCTIFLNRNG